MGPGIDNCCEALVNPCCCDDDEDDGGEGEGGGGGGSSFVNVSQTCINACPDGSGGDPISVTVDAGSFSAEDQDTANAVALASACAQAAALRASSPCMVSGNMVTTFSSVTKTAAVCGFSEWADPSTPPKKYRILTFSGTYHGQVYDVSGTWAFPVPGRCEDGVQPPSSWDNPISGFLEYVNCTMTGAGTATSENFSNGNPDYSLPITAPLAFASDCETIASFTKTVATRGHPGNCCVIQNDAYGFPLLSRRLTGALYQTLSAEDTDADAIGRATPVSGTSNVAKYQSRSGFSFEYVTVEVEFDLTGLAPGVGYVITLPIVTADYGGANQVPSIVSYPFTAGGASYNTTDEFIAALGKQITLGTASLTLA